MELIRKVMNKMNPFWKKVFDKVGQQAEEMSASLADLKTDGYIPNPKTELEHENNVMLPDVKPPHVHKWKKGMLPGQVYIKTCSCGATEKISQADWLNLG